MDGSLTNIEISRAAELYNNRFDEYGRNIKTVGWGSEIDQKLRFEILLSGIDPRGKTILDLGCGLGDLIPYLIEKTSNDFKYIGIDVAEKLIVESKKMYDAENIIFQIGDIFSVKIEDVDLSVLSGALSFKLDGIEEYAYSTMNRMFQISKEAACLNFLSTYVDYELPKNQHYVPEKIFSKAMAISKSVKLIHDYPLYEFTIQMFH